MTTMLQDDTITYLASTANSLMGTGTLHNVHRASNISKAIDQLGRAGLMDMVMGESPKQVVGQDLRLSIGRFTGVDLTEKVGGRKT